MQHKRRRLKPHKQKTKIYNFIFFSLQTTTTKCYQDLLLTFFPFSSSFCWLSRGHEIKVSSPLRIDQAIALSWRLFKPQTITKSQHKHTTWDNTSSHFVLSAWIVIGHFLLCLIELNHHQLVRNYGARYLFSMIIAGPVKKKMKRKEEDRRKNFVEKWKFCNLRLLNKIGNYGVASNALHLTHAQY